MSPNDFVAAKHLETQGWEYLGLDEGGDMKFCKLIGGVIFSATVREDR